MFTQACALASQLLFMGRNRGELQPRNKDNHDMKKTITKTKTDKSPAPATAATLLARKSTREPRVKTSSSAVPLPENTNSIQTATVITARIDVGFGNSVFIRGDGPGLSWDKGMPLICASGDQWTISVQSASKPIVFKFLLNDEIWSVGGDYSATPGATVTLSPAF
jgi:hypothetical protein